MYCTGTGGWPLVVLVQAGTSGSLCAQCSTWINSQTPQPNPARLRRRHTARTLRALTVTQLNPALDLAVRLPGSSK
ncbi:hypothetical protein HYDPIDRAFT_109922, partial [Hydnomerulius pinastri MD-312]